MVVWLVFRSAGGSVSYYLVCLLGWFGGLSSVGRFVGWSVGCLLAPAWFDLVDRIFE